MNKEPRVDTLVSLMFDKMGEYHLEYEVLIFMFFDLMESKGITIDDIWTAINAGLDEWDLSTIKEDDFR